nr:60S ribosomal protein L34 [Tanacetum cinerariifolium]
MFLEHHGYDLSHWTQTEIRDDVEVSDVGEMEDLICYGASYFIKEDHVVILYRSINDPFLNKLCNGTFISAFSDKWCSQPSDLKLPWNEMKPSLGLRFEHPEQLKECLTNYVVANGYQLWKGKVKGKSPTSSHANKGNGVKLSSPIKKEQKGVQALGFLGARWKLFSNQDFDSRTHLLLEVVFKSTLVLGSCITYYTTLVLLKMNVIGNIDPEAKQWHWYIGTQTAGVEHSSRWTEAV